MADKEVQSFADLEKAYCAMRQKVAHLEHVINCERYAAIILKKYPGYECSDLKSSIGRALIRLAKHQSSNGIM